MLLDYSEQPEPTEPSAEPTEPSEEPTAEPTDPTEPTEPETGFTVTFKGEGGYAKVNGEKVTSVTLEPGVNWLNFNLYGDHSEGFDLLRHAAARALRVHPPRHHRGCDRHVYDDRHDRHRDVRLQAGRHGHTRKGAGALGPDR